MFSATKNSTLSSDTLEWFHVFDGNRCVVSLAMDLERDAPVWPSSYRGDADEKTLVLDAVRRARGGNRQVPQLADEPEFQFEKLYPRRSVYTPAPVSTHVHTPPRGIAYKSPQQVHPYLQVTDYTLRAARVSREERMALVYAPVRPPARWYDYVAIIGVPVLFVAIMAWLFVAVFMAL